MANRFIDAWNKTRMDYAPLNHLISKVDDINLRKEMEAIVKEMQEACWHCRDDYVNSLPSADD
jgi:hypothetical protein